ncbi:MAG: hypothetical protein WD397_06335, partial [Wenzhouxiangellaceae bacterium]
CNRKKSLASASAAGGETALEFEFEVQVEVKTKRRHYPTRVLPSVSIAGGGGLVSVLKLISNSFRQKRNQA